MKHYTSIVGFASGCAATAVVAWFTVGLSAQRIPLDPATSIHACVTTDGVMRMTDLSAECPAGQKSVFLKKAEADIEMNDQTKESPPKCEPSGAPIDAKAFAALEHRVKELEELSGRGELGSRVVAPFEVVDRAGNRVFYVSRDNSATLAQLYNSAGEPFARIAATEGGGQFVGQGADSAAYVGVFSQGTAVGLKVLESGIERLHLGRDASTGRYSLKVFAKKDVVVAGIGQEQKQGMGLAVVADNTGTVRAQMGITPASKGWVALFGPSQLLIGEMVEDESGAGYLSLRNSKGDKMVGAGVHDGIGFVSTGPAAFKPGYGLLGLPASYIAGKR